MPDPLRDDLGGLAETDPALWLTVDYGGRTVNLIAKTALGLDAQWMYDHFDADGFEFLATTSGRKVNRRYVIEARLVPREGHVR